MECSICLEKLFKKNTKNDIFSTPCGHCFHKKCIEKWLIDKKECPLCQRKTSFDKTHPIYIEIIDDEKLLMTRISDVSDDIKKSDNNTIRLFDQMTIRLTALTDSVASLQKQNEQLQNELSEVKVSIVTNASAVEHKTAEVNDNSKAKDLQISCLQKEVSDLKNKRAETTREMNTIREQINILKATVKGERVPLKEKNEQKQQSLTLKFDDFSDKLIIE